jgi:glycosyltransferase involved in cell wall biosynthesis
MARRLKIAFVVDSARSQRAGGLVSAERIIDALREHHDVISVGLGGDVDLEPLQSPIGQGLIDANSFTFAKPDDALLGRAFDGVDVVHVQLPFFLGFRALAVAESLQLPTVAAHHVQPENLCRNIALLLPLLKNALGNPALMRGLNRVVTRTFYNRATAIICPSQLALEELRNAGLTTPAVVISNGAPARFTPLPSHPPGTFTVLTVGRLVPEKRHDVLLEAVRRSKHAKAVRVVIVGRGPMRAKLEALATDHPAQVELGFKSDEELLRLYQTADLYVHASEVELEGMAVLEAMRCGCPSVTCDSPSSAAKQFALGATHLFPHGDAQALADRIDAWFEHPEWLPSAREKTLAAVKDYGLDHTIEAYEQLYERVANAPRLARPARPIIETPAHPGP